MPLANDRKLTPITRKAHIHLGKVVAAYKKRGIPESNTHLLSELILSLPIPNGNGSAHWVGEKPKAEPAIAAGGDTSTQEGKA